MSAIFSPPIPFGCCHDHIVSIFKPTKHGEPMSIGDLQYLFGFAWPCGPECSFRDRTMRKVQIDGYLKSHAEALNDEQKQRIAGAAQ